MILHHVAQRTGRVVIHRTRTDALALGDGNLHVIDIARAPHALEDRVGEAQHKKILYGLLAQVMVDAKDLRFVEVMPQHVLDFERALEVAADRFLDHDPREVGGPRLGDQTGAVQTLDAFGHRLGRHRKIVDAIRRQTARRFDLLEALLQTLETVGLVEARKIVEPGGKLAPTFLIEFKPRETRSSDTRGLAKFLDRHRAAGEAQHRELLRRDFLAARAQIIQGGYQFALRQIARSAEDHDGAGRRGLRFGNMNRFAHRIILPLKLFNALTGLIVLRRPTTINSSDPLVRLRAAWPVIPRQFRNSQSS